jgi:protein required for attachment to host cells
MQTRFAKYITGLASEFIKRNNIHHVVLMAEPHMLGLLRKEAEGIIPHAERSEFPEDLSWHTRPRIQDALIRHGIMPQRAVTGGHRPYGQEPQQG